PDSGQQCCAPPAGRRKNRTVGEDRHDELLQRLRGEPEVITALLLLALAQTPSTSTIVVLVSDQSGGVITDAKVAVINTRTGAIRESASGADGSASFPALSLTGTYNVTVSKQGFGSEERSDVMLRAGETATLKVKL